MFSLHATTRWDWTFRIARIDIRVHPLFWLVTFLMADHRNAASVFSWFLACFFSILIHELGHVLAMRWTGGDGCVLIYGFGGLAIPTRGARRKSTADQVTVSFAGPLAGFVLATLTAALVVAVGGRVLFDLVGIGLPSLRADVRALAASSYSAYYFLHYFANHLLWINLYWGLINLLPVLPLDGGHIAEALLSTQANGRKTALQLSAVTAALVALAGFATGSMLLCYMFGFFAYQSWDELNRSAFRNQY
jgi:stage IV sporulation protein FB